MARQLCASLRCVPPPVSDVESVLRVLRREGAVCYRGTGVAHASQLARFLAPLVDGQSMAYFGGTNDRTTLSGGDGGTEAVLDTGSEPGHLRLREHSEMAYVDAWPGIIAFGCVRAPQRSREQGQTTVVRATDIVGALPTRFVERLRREGLRHHFWYHDACVTDRAACAVKSWQDAFLTPERSAVEALCHDRGWDHEWRDGGISISFRRDAFVMHPHTGDEVLFCTDLSGKWYDDWPPFGALPDAQRPYSFTWGGESREVFSEHDRSQWSDAVDGARHLHAWEEGDVLICDNMLVMHGREPFEGSRTIGVVLAHPVARDDVALG